jgi:quinoprotein glucose dehydrogenase
MPRLVVLAASFLVLTLAVAAFPPESPPPAKKPVGRSVKDSLAEAHVAGNLKVELWAAEPLLQNPVAISFDPQGRLYVAETTRLDAGVPDTRRHMYWMEDDIAAKTVADRLAIYKKTYPGQKPYEGFEKNDDQIHLVWDSTGSGVADKSTVFAKGFNQPADGIAAGVLPFKDKVYFACIPSVWMLRDTKGTGVADEKSVLSTGYGVRSQYTGHDLHGLRIGPDGRLYFSIGDRALNVTTKEGTTIANTESGAVLRCEPDGSHLELVHSGLRNPQKLAFDDAGNLFTYDNNSDSGDMARWVYITQGGESGWRCGYQYGTDYNPPWVKQGNRGPFNAERVWYVPGPGGSPPPYVTPPLAHFGNGPSGITHYPGTGLSDRYRDHFFATDFAGSTGGSVIWSLTTKAKGAGFDVVDLHKFVTGMLPTDCEFGPDGAFYWSDWVTGWTQTGTGRIFKVSDVEALKNPAVADAQKLLAEGFEKRPIDELVKLLASPHQLVRQSAQFELADRKATGKLAEVAASSPDKLARCHAIWGLGMIARKHPETIATLMKTTADSDGEIRAQSAKMLGDVGKLPATAFLGPLTRLLVDPEPRVRYFAALAYGRLESPPLDPLIAMLRTNNDVDPYLRQAAVVGLTELVSDAKLAELAGKLHGDDSAAVRLGIALTCRRHKSPAIAQYLEDANPTIVEEAARAINDERIADAYPALAKLADRPATDPVAYRALNAAFKIGTKEQAERVAAFAAKSSNVDHVRAFALKLLGDWTEPYRRDHVTGLAVDLPKRDAALGVDAFRAHLAGMFVGSDLVLSQAAKVATKFAVKDVGPIMATLVRDPARPLDTRVQAMAAAGSVGGAGLDELVAEALAAKEPELRVAARSAKARRDAAGVLKSLPALLDDAQTPIVEKQGAFAILASQPQSTATDRILIDWLDRVQAGKAPPELVLDVLDTADGRVTRLRNKVEPEVKKKLTAYQATLDKKKSADPLSPWMDAVAGGDPAKGRHLFLNSPSLECQRCHKLAGTGGSVGPPLDDVAAKNDRRYLLESVVFPSAKIAKGYETVNLVLADGRVVSGIVKGETKTELRLMTADGKEQTIAIEDIEGRRTGPSAMPADFATKMTRRDLRDLVAFLAELKGAKK